jgi:hypothetical protein
MLQPQLPGLSFKPVQVDCQLADLPMQLRNQLLLVLHPRLPGLEQLGQVIPNRRAPWAFPRQKPKHSRNPFRSAITSNANGQPEEIQWSVSSIPANFREIC